VRFGEPDEGFELASGRRGALLGCSWVVAHIAHVEVGFDELVTCFFGDDGVFTSSISQIDGARNRARYSYRSGRWLSSFNFSSSSALRFSPPPLSSSSSGPSPTPPTPGMRSPPAGRVDLSSPIVPPKPSLIWHIYGRRQDRS
jgi:hypothetical protein